jgi:putative PIN family toxin of toxin-antitoxin system
VRVVLDTNTVLSAILSPHGSPRRLLNAANTLVFDLVSSPVLMAELLDVIQREKFAKRFAQMDMTPLEWVREIRRLAVMVTPDSVPRVIANDLDDYHVLACALAGHADLIVSGDKHLHNLVGEYQGIAIVNVAEALQRIGHQ